MCVCKNICMYAGMHVFMYMCVCLCARARVYVCVCVCVCLWMCMYVMTHESWKYAPWVVIIGAHRRYMEPTKTHSYVCHDSFICVPWLIVMCVITHLYVCHDSWLMTRSHACYASWLIHICVMTVSCLINHSHKCHESWGQMHTNGTWC